MNLDQAIALVPERWEWSVGSGNMVYGDRAWANVWPCDQPFPNDCDIFEEGDAPADALEKAATRAQALVAQSALRKEKRKTFNPLDAGFSLCADPNEQPEPEVPQFKPPFVFR